MTEAEVLQISKSTVINSITSFIKQRINTTPKFQILDLIIPTERKIRSIVGGMETSLGTTLWEPLAKNLASKNGFQVINQDLTKPTNMPSSLNNILQNLIEGRKNGNNAYDAEYCHNQIKEVCKTFIHAPIASFSTAPRGFGVDIWLKKDDVNYFFDTKTVQPNVGGYSKFFEQVLNWYAFFYSKFPMQKAEARIVFPYNPYGNMDFWKKTIGGGKPLEPNKEGWVENQFWDFCSGVPNTYQLIYQAFETISSEGTLNQQLQKIFYND